MRIEKLLPNPDRVGRYRVQFEDGTILRLYRQTIADFSLYAGMELSEREWECLQNAEREMSAKMRAVRIVSASNVSEKDLQQRLIQKGEDPECAKRAVSWMAELDLVDDRVTAEQIVDRCARKGYGLSRARQVLYEKRIPKDIWDEVLADYPDQSDAIAQYLDDKLPTDADEKAVKRVIEALLRRGHKYSDIRRQLQRRNWDPEDFNP